MATRTTGKNNSAIFWVNDTSDEDQPMVFIPGVSREANQLTAFRFGSGTTSSEKKVKIMAKCGSENRGHARVSKGSKARGQPLSRSCVDPTHSTGLLQSNPAPAVKALSPTLLASHNLLTSPRVLSETTQAKSRASLKDLCPEDKRRIANLIQELARVSEEKEESVQRLREEQETFERKIQQMEQQNQLIVQERGSLQQQYRECQELLGLYQQYLSQQQEKLNQSIALLSHTRSHSKAPSSEEASSRAAARGVNGSASLWNGSYLGMPTAAAREPSEGGGGAPSFTGASSLSDDLLSATPPPHSSSESELTPTQGLIKRRGGPCQGGGGPRSEPRPAPHLHHHHRREHHTANGSSTEPRPAAHAYTHLANGYGEHPHASTQDPPPRLGSSPEEHRTGPGVEGALTTPLLGREDWEEKRHRLLLQKMQLEVERERLQARLAQQEERLIRQNQQLRQSRLDYSRFQQATAAELGHSISRKGPALPRHEPLPNGHALPSELRDCDDAEDLGEAAEQPVCEELPQKDSTTHISLQNGIHAHETTQRSRRDMATSPVGSQSSLKTTPVPMMPPVLPTTPHTMLDSSLIELLEVFSPISVPERSRPSVYRGNPTQRQPPRSAPRPARHVLLSPPGPYHCTPQKDLEESQILEEIFFIC